MTLSQWVELKRQVYKFMKRGAGNRDKVNELLGSFGVNRVKDLDEHDKEAFAKKFKYFFFEDESHYGFIPEDEDKPTTVREARLSPLDQRDADDKAKAYRERVRAIAIPVLASMQAIPSHGDDPRLDVDRAIKLAVLLDTEINKL